MTEHVKLGLPRCWVLMRSKDIRMEDFSSWFSKKYNCSDNKSFLYYGYDNIKFFKDEPKLITLDDWDKRTQK